MFVTKTSLPRRTFLRGMGVALGCRCWTRWCRRSRRRADGGQPAVPASGRSTCRTA